MQKLEQIDQRSCLDTTLLDPMTALMLQGKIFFFPFGCNLFTKASQLYLILTLGFGGEEGSRLLNRASEGTI